MNFRKDSPEIDITSPDVPMFKDLPREKQLELLGAWLDGKQIGYYNSFKKSWILPGSEVGLSWFGTVRYRVMED